MTATLTAIVSRDIVSHAHDVALAINEAIEEMAHFDAMENARKLEKRIARAARNQTLA